MAVYKIFPTQDATMYSMFPNMNTGLDEIVESTLTSIAPNDPNPQVSRFLIKFNQSVIEDVVNNKIGSADWQANLRCFVSKTTGLELDTTIDVWAVSGSWDMGTGKYLDDPITTNGVSWIWTDYSGSSKWNAVTPGPNVTSSYNPLYAPVGGGTWYSQIYTDVLQPNAYLSASQVYNYASDTDLNVDVTNMVNVWLTGSLSYYANAYAQATNTVSTQTVTNDGFLVKQRLEFVNSNDVQPEIKYFSIDTNTIYPPQLELKWDDFTYSTGSLSVLDTSEATLTLAENPGVFYSESINRFRVNARPQYPIRTWGTGSWYTINYALPTASYWALKDLDTNEYVVDFDSTYTKLSCDDSGSYFDVYMNGLEPQRYYQILIKTELAGSTIVFDDQYYFKVING